MAKKQTLTRKHLKPPTRHSSAHALKIYWPYIPLLVLLFGCLYLNIIQPLQHNKTATLAYSTEMSRSNLLTATNTERNAVGASSLTINDKLNASAQAKANDMVSRDYWAHNTPEGQEPWIFIDAQGYMYTKAGENLAYGFSSSNSTITGWMNSPSHKANLLDTSFQEVGFGFANSENFVGTGQETIVVAHYAKPVVSAPVPAPAPTPATTITPQTKPANTTQSTPVTEVVQAVEDVVVEPEPINAQENTPITTETPVPDETPSQRISLLQTLTKGRAPWSAVVVSLAGFTLAMLWIIKHAVAVRKMFIEGEHFVAHHPVFDLLVIGFVSLAVYLSQISGVIK